MYPDDSTPPSATRRDASRDPASESGLARLLAAVEELPLRYAPFYARLAALWDVSEAEVQATLARARDARAFRATGLPGVRRLRVSDRVRGDGARLELLRLAPGAYFPAHVHAGHEAVLVLEGSYRDDRGREVAPGDAQEMPPGSAHSLRVSRGSVCVAAVVSRGFAFTSLPLRLLELVAQGRR